MFIEGLGVIDDYMASEDLNECVDALLLKRSKAAFEQHAAAIANAKKLAEMQKSGESTAIGISPAKLQISEMEEKKQRDKKASDPSNGPVPKVVIRHRAKGSKQMKRLRKNSAQNKILMTEFQKNPHWSKRKIQQLHERLGLKCSQIYKWNWDMLRKSMETDTQLIEIGGDLHRNPYSAAAPAEESGSNLSAHSENESDSQSAVKP